MTEQRMVDVELLEDLAQTICDLSPDECMPSVEAMEEKLRDIIASSNVGWQPIETAPMDGTVILVCEQTEPGWWEIELGWIGSTFINPSHWMPLPQPPKED